MTKVSGDLNADFGFTGDYYDSATGLSLTMYRTYDPNLGRWLSRDPSGEAGGLNLYGYVFNNPISYIDPLGLAVYVGEHGALFDSDPLQHTAIRSSPRQSCGFFG